MSFKDAAEKYRSELYVSIERGDKEDSRASAIAYAALLRQIAGMLDSYADRAFLTREADKYEYIAAVITKWGVCDELYRALKDPAPHLEKQEASKPAAEQATLTETASEPPRAKRAAPRSKQAVSAALPPLAKPATRDPLSELLSEDKPRATPTVKPIPKAVTAPASGAEPMIQTGVEWIADLMEKYIKSVWVVKTGSGSGTGFFISGDGYFLTNRHVVYDGESPEDSVYVVSNDETKRYPASIVKVSKTYDVALLKVIGMLSSVPPLPLLRDFSVIRPGCDMMIIGNGLGYGLAPITGTVKYPKAKKNGDMIYTALTNNGDSGSPVLNRNGFVIGIHKSIINAKIVGDKRIEAKGMSNATPVCDILKLLDEWGVKI